MTTKEQQLWDLWIADVGATSISFARGRLDPTDTVIVHAAPEKLNAEVRNSAGMIIARGENLSRSTDTPMARLRIAATRLHAKISGLSSLTMGRWLLLPAEK